jgi:hypothetical protein
MDRITKLAELIRKLDESFTFTMLEIGGVPLSPPGLGVSALVKSSAEKARNA